MKNTNGNTQKEDHKRKTTKGKTQKVKHKRKNIKGKSHKGKNKSFVAFIICACFYKNLNL